MRQMGDRMISSVTSLRHTLRSPQYALLSALIFTVLSLAGCGSNCYSGFINGGLQINTASPPSACSQTKAQGTARTAIVSVPSCESCTSSARVEHLYVTLRGVKLLPSAIADQNSPDWVEIAPQLADYPRQVDLIGDSAPELLAESPTIPAESYRQVRLEFLPDAHAEGGEFHGKSECGTTLRNCIVMGDRRVSPILWRGDVPQLVIKTEGVQGGALVVLPETTTRLQLTLEPQQVFISSDNKPFTAGVVLVGHASAVRYAVDGQRDR